MRLSQQQVWVLLATILPAVLGLGGTVLAVVMIQSYGYAVFLSLPVVQAFLSAFLYHRGTGARFLHCLAVSYGSLLLLAVILLCSAVEGAICLAMAAPLIIVSGFVGAVLGYHFAEKPKAGASRLIPFLVVLSFPMLVAFEYAQSDVYPTHEVSTRLEINAPIETVWREVIAFDRIEDEPEGIFRWGIAYPIEARIDGEGVGAVRHCVFSTGPFVEPITKWEAPHTLEFDVTSNPEPMQEFSPWGHIDTPHLHDTFTSSKGRFRLWEENGVTVIEGTTWYSQKILPDFYWHRFSDYIIHRIHLRVLEHIRKRAESESGG